MRASAAALVVAVVAGWCPVLCAALGRPASARASLNRWLESVCAGEPKCAVASVGRTEEEDSWGLVLKRGVRKGEAVLEVPLARCVTATGAYEGALGQELLRAEESAGEAFPALGGGWSLVALQLARGAAAAEWSEALPDLAAHPLLLSDEDAAALDGTWSSRSLEALRANARDDYLWLSERGLLLQENVDWERWRYLSAVALSRAVEVEGDLLLAPGIDFANHDDLLEPSEAGLAVRLAGGRGFSLAKEKAQLVAPLDLGEGQELRVSYGDLAAAEFYERYAFCPKKGAARRASAVCELRFELDPEDRFLDDKTNVLADAAAFGADGDPEEGDPDEDTAETPGFDFKVGASGLDPDLLKFCRLVHLGGADAFLLEPVFSREIWGFLDLPVSEDNERAALEAITRECLAVAAALQAPCADPEREAVRATEVAALEATVEALDARLAGLGDLEYYQERRLKDLGLDSEWSQDEAQWAAARSPGSVDW